MYKIKAMFADILLLFIIFQTLILKISILPSFYSYWDEIIAIIFALISVLLVCKNKRINMNHFKLIILLNAIIAIGIIGNFFNHYFSNFEYIFRDIINCIKFPLVLIVLRITRIDQYIANYSSKYFFIILKVITIIIFAFGIFNLFIKIGMSYGEIRFGIRPYVFLFSHPTFLVLSCIFMITLFEVNNLDKKNNKYQILLIVVIILTMRTKGIVFCGIFIFIKYFSKMFIRYKIVYWLLIILIAYYSLISKVDTYLNYSTSAREVLYVGSIHLAKENFPIGSGFATFASRISWKAESKVYNFIIIPINAYENCNPMNVLGDTGYPYYIGQLGVVGFGAFILFLYKYYKVIKKENDNIIPEILLGIYVVIALSSESILVNNGVEIAFVVSVVHRMGENNEKNRNCV